mmetsp:Transcript_18025/g.22064  ORF Transcript_18025/g.22064 Transcript_18025/m.22064 type:complete len:253 (+) Transcript_18025:2-760(+)
MSSTLYYIKVVSLSAFLAISRSSAFIVDSTPFSRHVTNSRVVMSESNTETPAISLDPKETALVLIEYQNEFTSEGGGLHDAVKECMTATGTLENSKKLMDHARYTGCTIIHVPITFDKGHTEISKDPYGILAGVKEGQLFTDGTWAAEFCDIMKPGPGDMVAKGKRGLCAFQSTNLDFILRQNGCKNLVLSGFLTNCCVESTMRTAYELGYKVYTVKDCCAATSIEGQNAAYEHTFGMFSIPTTSSEIISGL